MDGGPVAEGALRKMTDAVAYRGPDGINHWVQGSVGLAHLQFCTTPEALREQQPLVSEGNIVVVCDGRVDNRAELLQELQILAPVTSESTDVDLVLSAYLAWGVDCVQHLFGDFAFAVWDQVEQRLFCARDHLGMRPFHYYFDGRRFIFGSEIMSLLQHPDVADELDEETMALYLLGRIGDSERTFYRNIKQIPPGHSLTVTGEGISKQLYWELKADQPIVLAADEDYVARFHELFDQAVRCRLRSITPVAVTLSGGLDSSSIACTAAKISETEGTPEYGLDAFSAVFEECPTADERPFIQAVHDKYEIRPHSIISDGFLGLKPLEGSYPLADHPFPIPYQARHEAILRQIKSENIRVVLSGEGGDEVMFGRVSSYFKHRLMNRQWHQLYTDFKMAAPEWRRRFSKQLLLHSAPEWLQKIFRRGRPAEPTVASIISDEFAEKVNLDHLVNSVGTAKKFDSPYYQEQYELVVELGRSLFLSYYSRLSLLNQVETRVPFLDARLVDFVCRVPPEQKVRQVWSKALLRSAMKGILPEAVRLRRDKGNFSPLFLKGLQDQEANRFHQLLENGNLTRLGYIDPMELKSLYAQVTPDRKFPVLPFIAFFSLESWLEQTFEGRGGGVLPYQTRQ